MSVSKLERADEYKAKKKKKKKTYHIIPATAAELALTWSTILKSKPFIVGNQTIMGNEHNTLRNRGLFDSLNIGFHQRGADLLALVFWKYCQRVNGDGTTVFIVTDGFAILHT